MFLTPFDKTMTIKDRIIVSNGRYMGKSVVFVYARDPNENENMNSVMKDMDQ